jgi:DNA-binding CsgD family transcriptional regulator
MSVAVAPLAKAILSRMGGELGGGAARVRGQRRPGAAGRRERVPRQERGTRRPGDRDPGGRRRRGTALPPRHPRPGQPLRRADPRTGHPRLPALDPLTDREREILILVAHGLSNDDIAARLFLSPLTAKTHVNRTMTKLGARDRAQLVVIAYRNGLLQPGDDLPPAPGRGA